MILIVGGTGTLGSETVRRLLAKGREVRVMTRDPSKAERLKKLGADIVPGDLCDAESLDRADQRWDPKTLDVPMKLTRLEDWAMQYAPA